MAVPGAKVAGTITGEAASTVVGALGEAGSKATVAFWVVVAMGTMSVLMGAGLIWLMAITMEASNSRRDQSQDIFHNLANAASEGLREQLDRAHEMNESLISAMAAESPTKADEKERARVYTLLAELTAAVREVKAVTAAAVNETRNTNQDLSRIERIVIENQKAVRNWDRLAPTDPSGPHPRERYQLSPPQSKSLSTPTRAGGNDALLST